MQETNRLGVRVVFMTVTVLVVLVGLFWLGKTLIFRDGSDKGDSVDSLSLTEARRDTDGDGVADFYETTFYNTDINKVDTDGDGVSDLDEITGGRDPRIPGPADVSKPATGSQITNLDTFTQRYLSELPDDVSRDDILDQARLSAFVEANRGELLPVINSDDFRKTDATDAPAIEFYLDSISSDHNTNIQAVTSTDLETAFRIQINSGNTESIDQVVSVLASNIVTLQEVAVPAEVLDLHTKFLAASIALHDNAVLLQAINSDFVGGLIAAKNVEDLGTIFQEVAEEVKLLEEKYELE